MKKRQLGSIKNKAILNKEKRIYKGRLVFYIVASKDLKNTYFKIMDILKESRVIKIN